MINVKWNSLVNTKVEVIKRKLHQSMKDFVESPLHWGKAFVMAFFRDLANRKIYFWKFKDRFIIIS